MPMSPTLKRRLFPKIPLIAERFKTPFQIDDEIEIRQKIKRLQEAFESQGIDFKEYYAVKANPVFAIQQIMKEEDCGFDCSSIPELRSSRMAGAEPEDIMFTSNNTSAEEFREALDHGGCVINLDDITFVEKLARITPKFPELISFRLNPGNRKTGDKVNSIIGNPVKSKYGVPIEQIVDAYRLAKEKGAKRYWLHTMVCSNDRQYTHMVGTLDLELEVAARLKNKLGIEIERLNMGGGIGIPYRLDHNEFDIEALARECKGRLDSFQEIAGFRPGLCLESGRYVTGPHGVLVNRVINVYEKYEKFVGVEVAMPALMRVGMYGSIDLPHEGTYHHISFLDKNGVEKPVGLQRGNVVGSICENCDRLANDILLPDAIEEGDFIVTHDTGAHGIAMGFNYNGRLRPQALLHRADGNICRVWRGETYEDLANRNVHGGSINFLKM